MTIRAILVETATMFDEWMSPDVMEVLIDAYAEQAPDGQVLKWEYRQLPARTWGEFVARTRTLYVNKSKTKNLFSQQVQTILHEIQHWNQLVAVFKDGRDVPYYYSQYSQASARVGYWKNPFEIDARAFADRHLEDAMSKLSRHYGGKIEGGSFDAAVEEIFDEFSDVGSVTRAQIGAALKAHDANTPENMKLTIKTLTDLGMTVK